MKICIKKMEEVMLQIHQGGLLCSQTGARIVSLEGIVSG